MGPGRGPSTHSPSISSIGPASGEALGRPGRQDQAVTARAAGRRPGPGLVGLDVPRLAPADDGAAVEDVDEVGQRRHERQVLVGDDHGDAQLVAHHADPLGRSRRSFRSRPAVGSSRMARRGSAASARPSSTSRRTPRGQDRRRGRRPGRRCPGTRASSMACVRARRSSCLERARRNPQAKKPPRIRLWRPAITFSMTSSTRTAPDRRRCGPCPGPPRWWARQAGEVMVPEVDPSGRRGPRTRPGRRTATSCPPRWGRRWPRSRRR